MRKLHKILFLLLWAAGSLLFAHQEFGIPCPPDLYLQKEGFSLGYSSQYRQAIWVAYTLTADHLQSPQVRRRNRFKADPAVKKNPVHPRDYARIGYDKGHLAPAADMTYSVPSMSNSFFMTNITPQLPGCNRGIWKRLETQVRRWALKEGELYIITGPVFTDPVRKIGKAGIPVPAAFYKIIYDLTPPQKMIAFLVPNQTSKSRIINFAVSVDEVERITGYDFFSGLDDETEKALEKSCDFKKWK